jgi:DNA polymerase-4
MIENPSLKNKVFAVGGGLNFNRGGILTRASYKARHYGIRSGMTIANALHLYPKLIVVPNRHGVYHQYSMKFIEYLKTYTHLVWQVSIDEAYVDVTDIEGIHPLALAKKIQSELVSKYQLPSSIGIAPTLFLAKMGSDMKKPMGITVIRKRDVKQKIYPLPIKDMYGLGKKTYPKLEKIGIHTIEDFVNPDNTKKILEVISQKSYDAYILDIHGLSSNQVDPYKYALPKSISNETTLSFDTDIESVIKETLIAQLKEAYPRMVHDRLQTKTVGIRLRYHNFETTQKVKSIAQYTDDYQQIEDIIVELFENFYTGKPVRLVGVALNNLKTKDAIEKPFDLFEYQAQEEKKSRIMEALKGINEKKAKEPKDSID